MYFRIKSILKSNRNYILNALKPANGKGTKLLFIIVLGLGFDKNYFFFYVFIYYIKNKF